MKRIGIFASGNGSNAENLARHFHDHPEIKVDHIFSNKPTAGVIARAANCGIPCHVFTRSEMWDGTLLKRLAERKIDFLVLSGFLLLVPPEIIQAFTNRIINIHPSLLPKFGGKGMYGNHVHEAVILAGEKESGITIHLVNEVYDQGKILAQQKIQLLPDESPDSLASRIHELEYQHFPETVEKYVVDFRE